jgi:hypothetical protein
MATRWFRPFFSREVLQDESVQKLINITTQTTATFTPAEYEQFTAKYPEKKALFDQLKKDQDVRSSLT